MGFAEDIEKWAKNTEDKLSLAVQKIALELFSRVILSTPVDSGRARANWQVAIGSTPAGTLDLNDKTGQATINKTTAKAAGLRAGDVIFLINNLPYIQRLEDGYSGQAPAGMVGLAVQDFQEIARQVGFELVVI
jgi:hypothetical protein